MNSHSPIQLPINEYFLFKGIKKIRLWKLDVEGHELEALRGASQSLRQQRVDAVLVEVSEQSISAVTEFLNECGYGMYLISPNGQLEKVVEKIMYTCNMIALPVDELTT